MSEEEPEKVVEKGLRLEPNKPDPDVIESLEQALAMAKEGKVQHLVLSTAEAGGVGGLSWRIGSPLILAGIISMTLHRIGRDWT